jgi:hypothetical protein
MADGYLGNERLKRVGVELSFTEEQLKEIILCTQDPVYFIKNYVKIVNIDKGLVPFDMWDFQEEMVRDFHKNRFSICKMPRQVGKTTTTVGYMLWCVLFQDDYFLGSNALEIIHDQINSSDAGWLVSACQHTHDGELLFDSHFPSYHSDIHLGENTIGAPSNIAFKNKRSLFFDRNLIWLMDCEFYKRLELIFGPPMVLNELSIVNRVGAHQVTNTLIHDDLVRNELRYVKNKYKIFDFLSSIHLRNLFLIQEFDLFSA